MFALLAIQQLNVLRAYKIQDIMHQFQMQIQVAHVTKDFIFLKIIALPVLLTLIQRILNVLSVHQLLFVQLVLLGIILLQMFLAYLVQKLSILKINNVQLALTLIHVQVVFLINIY